MSNVILVLQARMGSSRLPGKVLEELVPGRSLLACLLDRLKLSETADSIVVATSDLDGDNPIERIARAEGVKCFRGSEQDVLARFVGATSDGVRDAVIVRICADSPLHDAEVVDRCVREYQKRRHELDYVSNMHPESFPYGLAVEVFSLDVLQRLDRMTTKHELREHVTSLVYHEPALFRSGNVACSTDLSGLRFTVDYPEDLLFVREVYRQLYGLEPEFSWHSTVALLNRKPELLEINAARNERLDKHRSLSSLPNT